VFRINDVFDSINGEVAAGGQGSVCRFIRFSGCNLQCAYCDTDHEHVAYHYAMGDLVKCIADGPFNVTITGGEPLLQLTPDKLNQLCEMLAEEGINRTFNIETNGSIAPEVFRRNVIYTMDYKLENSGMDDEMKFSHFVRLRNRDFIKFVVNPGMLQEALDVMVEMRALGFSPTFAISPVIPKVKGKIDMTDIAAMARALYHSKFAKEDGVIFSLQLHKILGVK
jgi:7-carboxy-7-deazaguanine synthase